MTMRFLYLGLAFIAGAATAAQVPVNAALRSHLAHPIQATFISFAVGMLGSLALCFVFGSPAPSVSTLSRIPWWAWCGGLFGALYVGSAIILSPRIGVAAMLSMVIAGQMVMSLLIDHYGLLSAPTYRTTSQRLLGAGLVAIGAAIMSLGK
jgi:transporter family-2 protein